MEAKKTHWRSFFPSDYLGASDLDTPDQILTLTVGRVEKKIEKSKFKKDTDEILLIAHWKEDYKPMIVNVVNSKVLISFSGSPYVEDWTGVKVNVYFNPDVTFGSETVGGLRFKATPPKIELDPEAIMYAVKQIEACQTEKEVSLCFDALSKDLRHDLKVKKAARQHVNSLKDAL